MANYRSYMHIEKLGTTDTEGILNGTCYLTYKIDGTNACVFLGDDGNVKCGSRKRELTTEGDKDNAGFAAEILFNTYNVDHYAFELREYLLKYPRHVIYGEWLVPVTIKRYEKDAWRKLYLFDVYDTETEKYLPYEWLVEHFKKTAIIPLIAKLENPTIEEIEKLLDETGKFLITDGIGEGIVIKNYDFVNRYGRVCWAKMLTEDFKKQKDKTRSTNSEAKVENAVEHAVSQLLTVEHIQKEHAKLIEAKGAWSSKYIFELLNRVWDEFIRDNFEIILKKFKLPTINFRVLRQMSDAKVKEVLGL